MVEHLSYHEYLNRFLHTSRRPLSESLGEFNIIFVVDNDYTQTDCAIASNTSFFPPSIISMALLPTTFSAKSRFLPDSARSRSIHCSHPSSQWFGSQTTLLAKFCLLSDAVPSLCLSLPLFSSPSHILPFSFSPWRKSSRLVVSPRALNDIDAKHDTRTAVTFTPATSTTVAVHNASFYAPAIHTLPHPIHTKALTAPTLLQHTATEPMVSLPLFLGMVLLVWITVKNVKGVLSQKFYSPYSWRVA